MKLSNLTKVLAPMALLVLASVNASATTCSSVNGTNLNNFINTVGSCTIGDVTFGNFYFNFTAGVNTGSPSGVDSPATPNPNTDVTLSFNEITSGTDAYGTTATSSAPIYEMIVNYSANNVVAEYQNEHYFVQYTVNVAGVDNPQINQVDAQIGGDSTDAGTGYAQLSNKDMCVSGSFDHGGGLPTDTCSTGGRNLYQAVDDGVGLALGNGTGVTAQDSSLNYQGGDFNNGEFNGVGASGSNNFGVYDQTDFSGGNSNVSASLDVTSVQNDFVEYSTVPEPGTMVLFGAGLLALGAIRRKKVA